MECFVIRRSFIATILQMAMDENFSPIRFFAVTSFVHDLLLQVIMWKNWPLY